MRSRRTFGVKAGGQGGNLEVRIQANNWWRHWNDAAVSAGNCASGRRSGYATSRRAASASAERIDGGRCLQEYPSAQGASREPVPGDDGILFCFHRREL